MEVRQLFVHRAQKIVGQLLLARRLADLGGGLREQEGGALYIGGEASGEMSHNMQGAFLTIKGYHC